MNVLQYEPCFNSSVIPTCKNVRKTETVIKTVLFKNKNLSKDLKNKIK